MDKCLNAAITHQERCSLPTGPKFGRTKAGPLKHVDCGTLHVFRHIADGLLKRSVFGFPVSPVPLQIHLAALILQLCKLTVQLLRCGDSTLYVILQMLCELRIYLL
jgi:hypothetical protein